MARIDNKRELLQLADQGDPSALFSCYLDMLALYYLKPFAFSLNLKASLSKNSLVTAITQASTIEAFNAFVIDNNLRTGDSCATFRANYTRPSRGSLARPRTPVVTGEPLMKRHRMEEI
jgi:hypothetical protein